MSDIPAHLHPMVVHFPIALFITAFGTEILGLICKKEFLHKTALYLFVLSALMTPLVVRTGIWEGERLQISHPLYDEHRLYALWTMWISLIALPILYLAQKTTAKYFKLIFVTILLSTAILIALTGDHGGRMVYEYGVGVEQ